MKSMMAARRSEKGRHLHWEVTGISDFFLALFGPEGDTTLYDERLRDMCLWSDISWRSSSLNTHSSWR